MSHAVYILGTSMTPFGRYPERSLEDLGAQAALAALGDAGLAMGDMQAFHCGNVMQANAMVGPGASCAIHVLERVAR